MKQIIFFIILLASINIASAQLTETLTLEEVIKLSREQSPDAILAKHRYKASYWEFRTYKAELLPSVNVATRIPQFNRAIIANPYDEGSYVEQFYNTSSLSLSINQNVPFTGGELFINSDWERTDQFADISTLAKTGYKSTPFSIGYRQPIMFYNEFKWKKKIEPLKYQEAQKTYISSIEDVSLKAVQYFFDLALAQQNKQVAEINYSNADTLYKIAQGRYQIGTIAENELMQMELSFLNAESSMNSSRVDLEYRKFRLRSFLGFNEKVDLDLIIPFEIPKLTIDVAEALQFATVNNPDILGYERQLIEADRNVAKAKSEKGLQANIYARFGLTQTSDDFYQVYQNLLDEQTISFGMQLPILDWGLGKGRYKMAQSSQEVTRTIVEQSRTDFTQNIYLRIMQFNLQDDQLTIAAKSDNIAQRRYDVTKQRFLIGKVDVLNLNVALSEKDQAKQNYISALRSYWFDYFSIRKITLYDFLEDKNLEVDFNTILD